MPEEINRVIVDHISNILFCPTKTAVKNLGKEGIRKNVHLVGDVMYDIALVMRKTAEKSRIIKKLGVSENRYLLATIHRPSNTDSRKNLSSIVSAIITCGQTVVFPAHPRTAKFLKQYGLYNTLQRSGNVILTPPLDYVDFQKLLIHSKKVLTDSGGVQKEAYFFKRPGIILREDTEWVEIVKDGWNVLVGANTGKIIGAINHFEPKSRQTAVFGDGDTAGKIVNILARCHKKPNKPQRDTKNQL
jgi:UDP-N-acetylglucosamine 2-epimerase (non-hydrolysing)